MRFLLISDTHGRLAVIDELADRVRADDTKDTIGKRKTCVIAGG